MAHKIDIIIPCYNYGHFLEECLAAIDAQTRTDYEVLVMDNASTDDTAAVAGRWMKHNPRIRYHRNETNIGAVGSMLRGIELTSADYVAILPADDLWDTTFVEQTCGALDKHPECSYAYAHWGTFRTLNSGMDSLAHMPHQEGGLVDDMPFLTIWNYIPLSFGVFRRSACVNAGGFAPSCNLPMLGDQYLWMRLGTQGPSFYCNEVLGRLRLHGSNLSNELYSTGKSGFDHIHLLDLVFESEKWPKPIRLLAKARQIQLLTGEPICSIVGSLGSDKSLPAVKRFIETDLEELQRLAVDVIRRIPAIYGITDTPADTDALLRKLALTQEKFELSPATDTQWTNERYSSWLHKRAPTKNDINTIQRGLVSDPPQASFQIFVRIAPEQKKLLAETLDNLNYQIYPHWHFHIITPLPPLSETETVSCLTWHTAADSEQKQVIDAAVASEKFAWIIELPAGAVLDQLCLWRVANEIRSIPDAEAFFVDDDVYDKGGARKAPRFKPGVNPAWMQSSDLAGPLFIRRDVWEKCGGASERSASPWYDALIRLSRNFGWSNLHHIPDVLISYPGQFPSDNESCLLSLVGGLFSQGIKVELEAASSQSWRIRYPMTSPPRVSIVVISQGNFGLLVRCVNSLIDTTTYPDYEIVLVVPEIPDDIELESWLDHCKEVTGGAIRYIRVDANSNFAARCNLAADGIPNELITFVSEGCVAIHPNWLEELVRTSLQENVAAASPRLITGGNAVIANAGGVLGLNGLIDSPYQGKAGLSDPGYLDCLIVARDVSILASSCFLVRTVDFKRIGCMDAAELSCNELAVADFGQKLIQAGHRLIYQPLATLVHGKSDCLDTSFDPGKKALSAAALANAERKFSARWLKQGIADLYWNPNLSLNNSTPAIETSYLAQWQHQPSTAPRIMARNLTNGQGDFRITSYLSALRNAGLTSECVWPQDDGGREPTTSEILRLAPDVVIVQHYINDLQLAGLDSLYALSNRPFLVYTLDDLLTNLAESNPFRKNIPADNRSRLKYALARCDRMVVSTPFLAESYRHLISDIRIVPNRLQQELWLPLHSRKRTGKKPRIGWAGGTTHHGDLILLKETIEQTRDEADWIFFGMCPDEILPLVVEYHPIGALAEYPARLAALNLDIAVAPLAQIPFNQGKSNLRLLEYGILGIPVVCTDIDPYQNSPACCVANTVEAWTKALRDRIHDADAREREGAALRQWVLQGYLLENHLEEWLSAHLPD